MERAITVFLLVLTVLATLAVGRAVYRAAMKPEPAKIQASGLLK